MWIKKMKALSLDKVNEFANENIVDFHRKRINSLENLKFTKLVRKNPYLFKAKNIQTAGELTKGLLDAYLSSSEEKIFGDFLEDLAIFIASQTCGGHKSTAPGVDLELGMKGTINVLPTENKEILRQAHNSENCRIIRMQCHNRNISFHSPARVG